MSDTRQKLKQAYEFIQKDQIDQAFNILRPITEAEPDNADAWWLMANAATEPRDARKALVNTLRVNPAHEKARDLLEVLNEQHPPADDELLMLIDLEDSMPVDDGFGEVSPFPSENDDQEDFFGDSGEDTLADIGGLDDIDALFQDDSINTESFSKKAPKKAAASADGDSEDFWANEPDDPFAVVLERDARQAGRSGGSRRGVLLVVAVLVMLVVVLGLFVVLSGGGDESDTGGVASDPGMLTEVAAADVNAENGTLLETVRAGTEQDAKVQLGADARAVYTPSNGGYALIVQLCTTASPRLPELVLKGIDIAAKRGGGTAGIPENLSAVGVSIDDCGTNDTLYRAIAPIDAAVQYNSNLANPEAALAAFQESWVVAN